MTAPCFPIRMPLFLASATVYTWYLVMPAAGAAFLAMSHGIRDIPPATRNNNLWKPGREIDVFMHNCRNRVRKDFTPGECQDEDHSCPA